MRLMTVEREMSVLVSDPGLVYLSIECCVDAVPYVLLGSAPEQADYHSRVAMLAGSTDPSLASGKRTPYRKDLRNCSKMRGGCTCLVPRHWLSQKKGGKDSTVWTLFPVRS